VLSKLEEEVAEPLGQSSSKEVKIPKDEKNLKIPKCKGFFRHFRARLSKRKNNFQQLNSRKSKIMPKIRPPECDVEFFQVIQAIIAHPSKMIEVSDEVSSVLFNFPN
jgi:hypothetical protein